MHWQAAQTEHRLAWITAICCLIIILAASRHPQWFDYWQAPLVESSQQGSRHLHRAPRPVVSSAPESTPAPVAPDASTTRKPLVASKPLSRNKATSVSRKKMQKPDSSGSGLIQRGTGYYVQLGAFKERARAKALAKNLSHLGWQAGIIISGRLHAVWVGPATTRAKAEQLQKAIAAKLHRKGFIIHQQGA